MAGGSVFDRLDADQRAAVSLRRNGAVSAGAGSGKTTVLAARYLDLMFADGADVGSILCLTFTRKAQAEMQARVWRELSSSTEPQARAQVERFAEASISTIDSFCSSVLRGSAQDYGYPPDFRVDDAACRDLAESEALRFLLARREDPALSELFTSMGFERAWRGLFAEAALRFATPAARPEGDFRSMPARAAAAREAAIARARAALGDCRAAIDAALAGAEAGATLRKAREVAALFSRLGAKTAEADGLEAVRAIADIALTGFGRSGTDTEVKEAAKSGRERAARLLELERSRRSAPLEAAILALLADFAETYRAAKRRAGVMGFHDVATSAIDLLSRRKELRAFWKRRFRYIMVDEFQDDNELQKELLYLLAEDESSSSDGIPDPSSLAPDKLFFVGDDKQSIYRFRGADVSVFNRLGGELGGAENVRLRTNYRSEPGLIEFFNGLFERVFAGAAEDYEARFEEALARAPSPGVEPSVSLLWKPRGGAEASGERSDDEALAEGIAGFIERGVREGGLRLPRRDAKAGDDPTRPAGYGDFAILLRSTSKQYLLERFFRIHGIGYTADAVRGLFVESVANDIYAALRLALLPDDRLAYATVLRSPLVALSDDGLVAVLSRDGRATPEGSPVLPFDPATEPALSPEDRSRLGRGRETYRWLQDHADREPIASLVSWLWFEAGLRLSILRRPDAHPYLEHYDYLFALAARSDAQGESLAAFLARLEPLMGLPEKLDELAVQREEGSGVRIMSVHRSKGLEFPIVILPWMENQGQADGPGEAFHLSPQAGLTLNLVPWDEPGATRSNVFFDEAKDRVAEEARAETKRLFYVACTRAESHLVFASVEPWRADGRGASFLGLLAPGGAELDDEGRLPGLPPSVSLRVLPGLTEEAYRRMAGSSRSGASAWRGEAASMAAAYAGARHLDRARPRRVLTATALEKAAVPAKPAEATRAEPLAPTSLDGRRLPRDFEALFGEACHAVLENWVRDGRLEVPGRLLDVLPGELRSEAESEALRLARGFLDSDLGRRLLGFPRVETEKGFVLDLGPAAPGEGHWLVKGRMDLVAESGEELLIVDFKSNATRSAGEYSVQMALYREAARAFAPGKRVESWLFWLRSSLAEERSGGPDRDGLCSLAAEASRLGGGTDFPKGEDLLSAKS